MNKFIRHNAYGVLNNSKWRQKIHYKRFAQKWLIDTMTDKIFDEIHEEEESGERILSKIRRLRFKQKLGKFNPYFNILFMLPTQFGHRRRWFIITRRKT